MSELSKMHCVPCKRGDPSLSEAEIADLKQEVPDWNIYEKDGVKRIERAFKFKNFAEALAFTNQVGEIAEEEDHHPAILTEWGKVTVTWWTHVVNGLHRNDFIMAAKSDELFANQTMK